MPTPTPRGRRRASGDATAALFVRIPAEQARRLDRAAFELGRPKQALVSELLERYMGEGGEAAQVAVGFPGGGRRRVTVETLEPDAMVVGHHSFRPLAATGPAGEVLALEEAAELLRVEGDVLERLAAAGEVPGRKLAGEWRFSRDALLAWLAAGDAGEDEGDR
jgi:excisionase family DNA binding protein